MHNYAYMGKTITPLHPNPDVRPLTLLRNTRNLVFQIVSFLKSSYLQNLPLDLYLS